MVYTSLTLPHRPNQKAFSELSGQCASACALSINAYYALPVTWSSTNSLVSDMTDIFNSSGAFSWNLNFDYASCDGSMKDAGSNASSIYQEVVDAIECGKLVAIHYYINQSNPHSGKEHWVVPVAYNSSNTSLDNLVVYDPMTRDNGADTTLWTLSQSKSYNMKSEYESDVTFYYGYVTSSPK